MSNYMTRARASKGSILGVLGYMHPWYKKHKYKSDQEFLNALAKTGCVGMLFGAWPPGFEWEVSTKIGRDLYCKNIPVKLVDGKPKINETWRTWFRNTLADLKQAQLLPAPYLFGGCDMIKDHINPKKPSDRILVKAYIKAVVSALTANKTDYLIVLGNEIAGLVGDGEYGQRVQNDLIEILVSYGVDRDWIRSSSLDNQFDLPPGQLADMEFWGALAFSPDGPYYNPKWKENRHHLGVDLHCVGSVHDFAVDRYMGRFIDPFGPANYHDGTLQNVICNTDGSNPYTTEDGQGRYAGITRDDLVPIANRLFDVLDHPLSGSCSLFSDLPCRDVKWMVKDGVLLSEWHLSDETLFVQKLYGKVYEKRMGKKPWNILHPPELKVDEPPAPPVPDVPIEKPEEPIIEIELPKEGDNVKLFSNFKFGWPPFEINFAGQTFGKKVLIVFEAIVHIFALIGVIYVF